MASFLLSVSLLVALAGYADARSSAVRTVAVHYPALYPEGFAWDDVLGVFISGSFVRGALFSISENGTVGDFVRDEDYAGMASTVGVTIDAGRRRLLAVINNFFDHPSSFNGLACYHLDTKSRLFLAKFNENANPNDVALDAAGNAYVTDVANDVILKISPSGESSVFSQSPLFTSQPIVAIDPPVARCGLNGIAITGHGGNHLLVVQTKSGKLFRVGLHDAEVRVVDMEKPLVAADGLAVRRDGLLVVVSTDVLWVVKSRDHWKSAYVVEEVALNRSLNSTTVALRGPRDDAFIIHTHFQDLYTVAEKGMEALPGGEFRTEFSFQEIKLPDDPDNNPLWLLLIPVAILVVFGFYKLQMKLLLNKYNQRMKRD